jgi:hypothetical protein
MCTWQDLPGFLFFRNGLCISKLRIQEREAGHLQLSAASTCKYLEASRLIVVQCLLLTVHFFFVLKVDLVVLSGYYLTVAQIFMMHFL